MSSRSIGLPDDIWAYLCQTGVRESDVARRLRDKTQTMLSVANMQIAPEQGQFLAFLAKLIGAKKAVEVGTFTGYSALCVADAMGADGRLIACDVSDEWTQIGRQAWAEAGVAERIDLHIRPALETLANLIEDGHRNTVDMALIDADKQNYSAYYDHLLQLVRPGGLIIVDNVLWSGAVADPSVSDPSTEAIRTLNQKIVQDDRVDVSMVPIGDGMTLVRRIG
ncbi:MAG: class I SAM-dependent methyltransferase [Pseudomonadota bacterium]